MQRRRRTAMGSGGAVPVQVLERVSKAKTFDGAVAQMAAAGDVHGTSRTKSRSSYEENLASASESCTATERDVLLMEHLPTVRYVARRIHERLPQHVDLEDLVSAGVVGLIDALSKFDQSKQVQFKSYAQFR